VSRSKTLSDGLPMIMVNIGFGTYVMKDRILAILNPDSAPIKRLRDESKSRGTLIDATQGRRTRSIILMDSGHIILSGVHEITIAQRLNPNFVEETPSE
jgi:extracellular matrix regulatory protein A